MRWVALSVLIILMITSLINYICCKLELKKLVNSYGKVIEVNGKKICVDIKGYGDKVIVLLTGAASPSPVLEMSPLAARLNDIFTVVTIEYFGYGLSDSTTKERTIENITEEIHCVLQSLGYVKYILMAHSISGVYGLYYSNKYSDEVVAFVGIDSSVPKQNNYMNFQKINVRMAHCAHFLRISGIYRGLSKIFPNILLNNVVGFERSKEENELLRKLYLKNFFNNTVMEEEKRCTENFKKAEELKIPNNIPVLFFLSSQTSEKMKQWYDLHKEIITEKNLSRIVMIEGSHYIHYQYSENIINIFKEWIAEK